MQNHTDLLNFIALKIKAKSYLEIGVYNPDHNFNKIAVPLKISVDPDPKAGALVRCGSDEFFKLFPDSKFDLGLIDGLHHADQVKRDLVNLWGQLNEGGVIVLHDCNPPTQATTCVPRGNQREWCGDVYKTVSHIDSHKITVDFDYGCTVIRKAGLVPELQFNTDRLPETLPGGDELDMWGYFDANRRDLLNLVTVEDAKEIISAW